MEHEHFFTILAIVIAFLSSSGAGAFLVRYGTRLKLQEATSARHNEDLLELKELNVSARLQSLESAVKDIKQGLTPLNQLPAINEKLEFLVKSVDHMMPKTEVELRFEIQDQKIQILKEELSNK